MPPWRETALKLFPEMEESIHAAETPYLLWSDLFDRFRKAYDENPRDDSVINRTYEYFDWCCEAPRGETARDDLLTCAAVCFVEHIPTHPKAKADIPRWFTKEDVVLMKRTFSYCVGEEGYRELLDLYPA